MASQLTKPDKSTLSKCGSPEPRTRTDQARRNCLFLTNRRSVSLTSIPSGTHLGAIHLSNTHIALEDHSALRDHVTLCPPPPPPFPSPLPAGTTYCRFAGTQVLELSPPAAVYICGSEAQTRYSQPPWWGVGGLRVFFFLWPRHSLISR